VKVRVLEQGEEKQPDVLVLFKNSSHSLFQTIDFNEIVKAVFATNLRFLIAEHEKEIIGICAVHEIVDSKLRSSSHSGPRMFEVPYGGWVLKDRRLELHLAEMIQCSTFGCVLYWSLPVLDPESRRQWKEEQRFETLVIDLSMSLDHIFSRSVDAKRRNMIRKAQKSGVSIIDGNADDLEVFYREMIVENNKKNRIPVHPKRFYAEVFNKFSARGQANLLMAQKDGEYLAGVLIVRNALFAHYWIGARRKDCDNIGQGEMLQWHAIQWAKKQGSRYYDLCGFEPARIPLIAEFKADFSKEIVPFYLVQKRGLGYRVAYRLGL